MRLLTWNARNELVLTGFLDDKLPPYAILSHTWGADSDEVTFDDLQYGRGQGKSGYTKIRFCGEQARKDGIQHFWVDTCCINKASESELSQAIRSMFAWYKNSGRCYVYLPDVSARKRGHDGSTQHGWESSFRNSRWFTRGWTLQELLAPDVVEFFERDGALLGDKRSLASEVHEITGIPVTALQGVDLDQFSIDERIRWTTRRQTKKKEDEAYCLLGIFKVHMPLMYGEGENALFRLRREINERWGNNVAASLGNVNEARPLELSQRMVLLNEADVTVSKDIEFDPVSGIQPHEGPRSSKRARLSHETEAVRTENGCSYASPATRSLRASATPVYNQDQDVQNDSTNIDGNEEMVQSLLFERIDFRVNNVKRPLSSTCQWLFQHPSFKTWYESDCKDESSGFLWIRGKPGCGKSTLMKAALEWIQKHKSKKRSRKAVVPYFFNARASASLEKSRLGLLRKVVHHLVTSYPLFKRLFTSKFVQKDPRSMEDRWTADELQGFLEDVVESNESFELYLFIDALDEAEYEDDVRRMIRFFVQLAGQATSPDQSCNLRICLSSRHYPHIKIGRGLSLVVEDQLEHGEDIKKYITKELTCDVGSERDDLQAMILNKSARVFLWVVLVVQILNQLDDRGAPLSEMKARLAVIPEDLNRLFAEILIKNHHGIETSMLLFQWMSVRMRPLEPAELFMAMEYSRSPNDPTWTLPAETSVPSPDRLARFILDCSRGLVEITETTASQQPVVQFIHETVREFLLKKDGLASILPAFATKLVGISHEILRVACLRCVLKNKVPEEYKCHYDSGHRKKELYQEFRSELRRKYPFLDYAVLHLFDHAEEAQRHDISQRDFLKSQIGTADVWIGLFRPWWNIIERYRTKKFKADTSLTHFVVKQQYFTLLPVLLDVSNTANATCKSYGPVIHTAVRCRDKEMVQLLLDRGADVNAPDKKGDLSPLIIASMLGFEEIVQVLLDRGANLDVRDRRGMFRNNALYVATAKGHVATVELMLDEGAEINREGPDGSALHIASAHGRGKVVQILLERGADVNQQGGRYGSALQAVSVQGRVEIVQMLLDKGANVNQQGGRYGSALQAASVRGRVEIVQMLLDKGANVNQQGGGYGSALQVASYRGHSEVVQILLERGADVNQRGGPYDNALQTASYMGHNEIVQMLLDKGADVNQQGGRYSSALQTASARGHGVIVQMLLDRGADINHQRERYSSALQAASYMGHNEIVQMLLDRGADVNQQGGLHGSAVQAAYANGQREIVQMLLDHGATPKA